MQAAVEFSLRARLKEHATIKAEVRGRGGRATRAAAARGSWRAALQPRAARSATCMPPRLPPPPP
jgi:hypothetical protein